MEAGQGTGVEISPGGITLYEHQVDDLHYLREHLYAALWHEVGSGKSFPLLARLLEILDEDPTYMAVIVAEKSLLKQWEEEIARWNGDPHLYSTVVMSGEVKPNIRASLLLSNPRIFIINYDFIQKVEGWLMEHANSGKLRVILCDEGHRLKGFRGFRSKAGKRSKILMRLAEKVKHRYIASGSPVTNPNSTAVFGIYHFLNPDIYGRTLWKFEAEYFYDMAPKGQRWKKLRLKPHMKGEMTSKFYSCARRLMKKDLPIDFPSETTIKYLAPMEAKLAKHYAELHKHSVAEMDGRVVARPEMLARVMALQQVASGFLIHREIVEINGQMHEERSILHLDSSHKDRVLTNILEEIGPDASVIIWAVFTHEIEHLMKLVGKIRKSTPGRADGKHKGARRDADILGFKNGTIKELIAHPAAAGAGLNLQVAGHDVRYSRTWKPIELIQSRGRNVRAGAKVHDHVTHHEIVTPRTKDAVIYDALLNNVDLSAEITLDMLTADERNQ